MCPDGRGAPQNPGAAVHVRYAVRSDLGLVRTNNEDSALARPHLLAVADGMGGHAGGEVASGIVIGTLQRVEPDDDPAGLLHDLVVAANRRIAEVAARDDELVGMGTTLTALMFGRGAVALAHIGDSRGYLLRDGALSQITHDDTFVQQLLDAGVLTEEQALRHPLRSVLLRALHGIDVEPAITLLSVRPGDRFLLCSDGLTDVVDRDAIAAELRCSTRMQAVDRLVELALAGGGPDNVTVIVADVTTADDDEGGAKTLVVGAVPDTDVHVRRERPDEPVQERP